MSAVVAYFKEILWREAWIDRKLFKEIFRRMKAPSASNCDLGRLGYYRRLISALIESVTEHLEEAKKSLMTSMKYPSISMFIVLNIP